MAAAGPPPPEVIAALAADPLPWANKESSLLGVTISLTVLLWISTFGRVWTRFFVVKKPWWDDFFCLVAVSMFTMSTVAICYMTKNGLGKHAALVPLADLQEVFLGQWIWAIGYAASTATIKISLLLQYLRVYERGTITYRFAQFVLVLVSLWGFALTFISIFVCFPSPAAFWTMKPRGCYGFAATNIDELTGTIKGHSASNFFLDVLVFLLAVRLQFLDDAQSNRKSMLAILFMGMLACGFALWRLIDIVQTGGGVGSDPTWNMPGPGILSTVEVFIGALCATIPFFWPAIREQFNKIFVSYDFSVSEVRVQDDEEYELAKTGSPIAGRGQKAPVLEEVYTDKPETKAKASKYKERFSGGQPEGAENMYTGGTTSNVKTEKQGLRF